MRALAVGARAPGLGRIHDAARHLLPCYIFKSPSCEAADSKAFLGNISQDLWKVCLQNNGPSFSSVPREAAWDAEGHGFQVRGSSHKGLKEIKYLLLQNWRFG